MIYISSNNDRHPVAKTFTSIHYTCPHFTSSHLKLHSSTLYNTLLHLSTLHFFPFKTSPNDTSLHFTTLSFGLTRKPPNANKRRTSSGMYAMYCRCSTLQRIEEKIKHLEILSAMSNVLDSKKS